MALKKEDLELGSLLGQGAFAKVVHARDTRNGDEYALKIVDKKQIAQEKRQKSVVMERKLLSGFNCPGIVRLHLAFHDAVALYFVLEYASGGELATQIARMGVCPLQFAQFYAAEIVAVLDYLRTQRVAHRDMKPENLLLTLDGHLKLIDFDAAVVVPKEEEGEESDSDGDAGLEDAIAVSFGATAQGQPNWAGTSLYLPPEVVRSTAKIKNAFALDLWAFGCIVYQMFVGKTPFDAPSEPMAFQLILGGDYAFPEGFPHNAAKEFVVGLLAPNPRMRLGQGAEGMAELRRHPFFGSGASPGDNFESVLQRKPPPRVDPRLRDASFAAGMSFESDCTPQEGHQFLASAAEAVEVMGSGPSILAADIPTATPPPEEAVPSILAAVGPADSPMAAREQLPQPRAAPVQAPPRREARAGMPVADWERWLRDMRQRSILRPGEDIRICGGVVKRRLPILKPRWLVVTDLPRLLVLDPSGLEVQHDIDFSSPLAAGEELVSVSGAFSFEVNVPGHRWRCSDASRGAGAAREWATEICQARSTYLSRTAAR